MLTFIKLGGGLITGKRQPLSFHAHVVRRLADEIAQSFSDDNSFVIGHGSGSFGHVPAKHFGTIDAVRTPAEWRGFAEVATIASELSQRVAMILHEAMLPVWRLPLSASALAYDGAVVSLALDPIQQALAHGLIPLVHGDVALDEVRGGTIISTEKVFAYLAQHLPVDKFCYSARLKGCSMTAGN